MKRLDARTHGPIQRLTCARAPKLTLDTSYQAIPQRQKLWVPLLITDLTGENSVTDPNSHLNP